MVITLNHLQMENEVDYLCLGQTVPERSKKYGLRVCTAGIDMRTMQLIRIYPLGVRKDEHFKRWHIYSNLKVRRNPKDNRQESWRLGIPIEELKNVSRSKVDKTTRSNILKEYVTHLSIEQLNEERKSLAIIRMNDCFGYFVDHNKKFVNVRQFCLFPEIEELNTFGKDSFKHLPRVKWAESNGKIHDYMLNSWDAYMHQINIAKLYGKDDLWVRMNLNKDIPKFGFIGNMNHQRNVWLIITIF